MLVVHGMCDRIGGLLFGLLFRFARTVADLHAVDFNRRVELRMRGRTFFVPARAECDAVVSFLAPLDQAAFVVGVGPGQFVDVQVTEKTPLMSSRLTNSYP